MHLPYPIQKSCCFKRGVTLKLEKPQKGSNIPVDNVNKANKGRWDCQFHPLGKKKKKKTLPQYKGFSIVKIEYISTREDKYRRLRFNKGQTTYIDIMINKRQKFSYIKLSKFKRESQNKIKTKNNNNNCRETEDYVKYGG